MKLGVRDSSRVKEELESSKIGECRGAEPLCQGFGGVPQSPKTGGLQGVEEHSQNAFKSVGLE